jgi:beta-glucosidase
MLEYNSLGDHVLMIFKFRIPLLVILGIAVFSLDSSSQSSVAKSSNSPPFRDPSASLERRVDDLISRMTLEEKVSQLMNDAPAIPRLGIPAYNWWNECLHGVARAGLATVFPETIGMAATWDSDLLLQIANVISTEARAKNNEFVRRGERNIYEGLTFWTPNINIFRDPRWGRGMETYGEDPYLTGRLATQLIKGLQGDDLKYLKTVATAKHYAVHSGPESERHTFDAVVDDRDLYTTYLPQFEMAIKDGGAQSVMCAYNRVDGQAACSSPRLLEEFLRKQWKFNGYVVSDCGAIGDIYLRHKVAPTPEQGVAMALKAGTDLNCGIEYEHLVPAVRQNLVSESEIDTSVRRLFTARFKLGMFDPPESVRYTHIPLAVVDAPPHRELALETARKSIVLLKNEGGVLPLSKSLKTVAVIGPNADQVDSLLGNYNGLPSAPVTPLEGIRRKLGGSARVLYARGSDFAPNLPSFETVPSSALSPDKEGKGAHGLKGEYFGSSDFDRVQHRPREMTVPNSGNTTGRTGTQSQVLFTRVDPTVDFQWWDDAPRPDMHGDDFGVRWTGYISAPVTGSYELGAIGMNAFELYFEDKLVTKFNNIHERAYSSGPVTMEAGKQYAIRLDYHEYENNADIRLVWSRPRSGDPQEEALAAAKQADAVILVLGLSPRLEGEEMKVAVEGFAGGDRLSLDIPRVQQQLLEKVMEVGKPVTLVLMNGSALSVNWAREHVPAIVEAWYPGQAGGDALADVLFGDYNPAGRLPVTFYQSADQLPPFTDYRMEGRTYRYFHGEPLFPFGFGLSYTKFGYEALHLPSEGQIGTAIKVSAQLVNKGKLRGEEVIELYVSAQGKAGAPIRSLAGFQRLPLEPGERRTVEFSISPKQLADVTADGRRMLEPGSFEISIGGKQPGFKGPADAATTGVVTGTIRLTGSAQQVE